MCIILLFSLLLVGYLNTGGGNKSAEGSIQQLALQPAQSGSNQGSANTGGSISYRQATNSVDAPGTSISAADNVKAAVPSTMEIPASTTGNSTITQIPTTQQSTKNVAGNRLRSTRQVAAVRMAVTAPAVSNADDVAAASDHAVHNIDMIGADVVTAVASITHPDEQSGSINTTATTANTTAEKAGDEVGADDRKEEVVQPNGKALAVSTQPTMQTNKTSTLSESDLAWIDNYAQYNRPAPKKWAGKLSVLGYVTPSVVYRSLISNVADKPRAGASLMAAGDVNNYLDNKPSFGIETGLAVQYQLARRIKLKAGGQLNYTRYNARAFENFHPIATLLTMNNGYPYEVFATTPYTNSFGISTVSLHNETYQFSLLFGADLRIAAIDNIEWYAGASIQPTVVLYGKSYVISTDRKNYVNDPSLLNRFNMNAGFETYLSFKTSKGYTLQAGPQFRSQLFTTNTRVFSVEERLLNYGFKVGISKKL